MKLDLSSRHFFQSVKAKVVRNIELRRGGEGSTLHIELDLKGTDINYCTADNLGICPEVSILFFFCFVLFLNEKFDLDNLKRLFRANLFSLVFILHD